VTAAQLRTLLSRVAFTQGYGFKLHSPGDGECALDVPFRKAFERPGGIVGGQVFMAAADVAMWLAIMTRLGREDRSVTYARPDLSP
jgi:acyl-coenzyme A thioesterase PaaI-like protein